MSRRLIQNVLEFGMLVVFISFSLDNFLPTTLLNSSSFYFYNCFRFQIFVYLVIFALDLNITDDIVTTSSSLDTHTHTCAHIHTHFSVTNIKAHQSSSVLTITNSDQESFDTLIPEVNRLPYICDYSTLSVNELNSVQWRSIQNYKRKGKTEYLISNKLRCTTHTLPIKHINVFLSIFKLSVYTGIFSFLEFCCPTYLIPSRVELISFERQKPRSLQSGSTSRYTQDIDMHTMLLSQQKHSNFLLKSSCFSQSVMCHA